MDCRRTDIASEIYSFIGNLAMGFGIGTLAANAKPLPQPNYRDCPAGIYSSHGVLHVIANIRIPTGPYGIEIEPGKMVVIINPSINRGNLVPWCGDINIIDGDGSISWRNYQNIPTKNLLDGLDELANWHMPTSF